MMVETDWREILNYSQRELIQADKEKLCENLSWMEADDIELNFTDLKTLFRLAQDILKYKSEQVNNLEGQKETLQRKLNKAKMKSSYADSPAKSTDNGLEAINHQEEVIKANKDILEQLYLDIAELEGRKSKLLQEKNQDEKDSESSRDVLSELNEVAQLENEITVKNRHIRKLLSDVKILEEENTKLKDKLTVTKEKLNEATKLIENLTDQLLALNNESLLLKDALGNSEESKAHLSAEIEALRKQIFLNDTNRESMYDEIKSKVQHWKNLAKMKRGELETLTNENTQLKESLMRVTQSEPSSDDRREEERKIKELQEKLSQASRQMENSADIIENLKMENRSLKAMTEDQHEYHVNENKNVSDENKEKIIMNKMKKKIKTITIALQEAEERISMREKELAEITSQLQLVKSDEGIKSLLEGLKNKKRQLKSRDEGIRSLIEEINTLNQFVDNLQLQNESLRIKFNVPRNEEIPTKGILKKLYELESKYQKLDKTLKKCENKLVATELDNRVLISKSNKLAELLINMGCESDLIEQISKDAELHDESSRGEKDGKGSPTKLMYSKKTCNCEVEMQTFIDENEGLRRGLQEILNFLKDNSATSSGILSVECPSLDAVLQSMEARHCAGWFAPHMYTVMELRAALGGRDALLTALHDARKETFEIMAQLSKETKKSSELEIKLQAVEAEQSSKAEDEDHINTRENINNPANIREFGSWVSLEDDNIDISSVNKIESYVYKRNSSYEDYLKRGLNYFFEKFKSLFEKMTAIIVQTADQQNQWSIQEEQYKAQIENLKTQYTQKDDEDDDISEDSPGLMPITSVSSLQRKCLYLEESYKYIRTLNENMKNEILENKKENMLATLEYETQIQSLLLIIANLFDKLRYSISIELFWKQNAALTEAITNYRRVLDEYLKKNENIDFFKYFDKQKTDIINAIRNNIEQNNDALLKDNMTVLLSGIEDLLAQESMKKLCTELGDKDRKIRMLEAKNIELQETQAKIMDESLATDTKEETNFLKKQLQKLADDNKILKDQYQHIEHQLDLALLQLQDSQQRKLSNDIEINMLRHQILDLQSTGDNKAIIARLSGEVLVAHLQASESHKKLERLNTSLNKEKQSRIEAEEMLKARQKIFDIYAMRYESKFKYMFDIMQILRQQYHGSLPITSLENYVNNLEDISRKTHTVNEKLEEIEDLQYSLMTKHSIYEQVLDLSKNKCLDEQDGCSHKLKNIVLQQTQKREEIHYTNKIKVLEKSREDLRNHCNKLENTLILINQGFEKADLGAIIAKKDANSIDLDPELELEDIHSDDESNSRRSQTITLKKPQILKPVHNTDKETNSIAIVSTQINDNKNTMINVSVQTIPDYHESISTQTDTVQENNKVIDEIKQMKMENLRITKELAEAKTVALKKAEEIVTLTSQKIRLETNLNNLKDSFIEKERCNEVLSTNIQDLKIQYEELKKCLVLEKNKIRDADSEENKSLLLAIKKLENDKNKIMLDYKELLQKERQEYAQATKELNAKIIQLQSHLDRKENENNATKADALKEVISKYTLKISSLEDKCFKKQSEVENCTTEMITIQSELDRWKDLAIERLAKMEQLNSQLEERHCHEVESYKAENQHWISQLNETQHEHMDLRSRLSEQKALHMKQMADKDAVIEQLRSAVNALKTQIISMQTLISVNDPSFDLSAIVEVDESIDALSQHGSDRLELKFDSSVDIHEMQDELMRIPASSTAIWQEPIIDRLRRDKQLAGKQNAILRRQIKALAARERRARLDAQNLKNQVFRISTSGSKSANIETATLQNKIASLQAQLTSARRDSQSSVALWDKWKRAQQATERWQARYDEKCQEVKKVEMSLNLAKSAVVRLEREKRLLLARLSEARSEKQITLEKQDSEVPEKASQLSDTDRSSPPPPVSTRALLDRVQAQQRRIAALEVAEKGNELLVFEYERALAEITSLKGQVLKLESTLLESQIRRPLETTSETQPDVDYWKSYCQMLKEENVQLNLRINALDTVPTTASQHRVNDLEQTVLTLRGLVSKLQAEQKSSLVLKRGDSRPNSGRSSSDMVRPKQLDTYRIEIANLKRSIQDKDLLLEKSKEMLKIAAEREDELLRENEYLRRRLEEITHSKGGFLSA